MNLKEVISTINKDFNTVDFQVIPSYSFNRLPKFPFSTYSETDVKETIITGEKERIDNNGIIKIISTVYRKSTITFKVYSNKQEESNVFFNKLQNSILQELRDYFNRKNVGITDWKDSGFNTETLESGQKIFVRTFKVDIGHTEEFDRQHDKLIETDLHGDIEKKIDFS